MVRNLNNRLHDMLNDDIMTDVTFIVQGTEIRGHRVVVGSQEGCLRELLNRKKAKRVDIPEEIAPQTFHAVLEYLYTDDITIDMSRVFELMHAATMFNLDGLELLCAGAIKHQLTDANVGTYATEALHFHAKECLKVCQDYFSNNTSEFIKTKEFHEISNEVLVALCSSDEINCSELDLFNACIKWAEDQCNRKNLDIDSENLQAVLGDVLNRIRFSDIPLEDFQKTVIPLEILSIEKVGQIIVSKKGKGNISRGINVPANVAHEESVLEEQNVRQKLIQQYFRTHTQEFMKTKEFLGLSNELLVTLCSSEALIECSELELFSACVEWAKAECSRQDIQSIPENLRTVLGDALKEVRFPVIPMSDFIEVVVPLEILTCEEVGQIIYEMQTTKKKSKYMNVCRENITIKVVIKGVNVAKKAPQRLLSSRR